MQLRYRILAAALLLPLARTAVGSQLLFGLDYNVAGSRAPFYAPQGLQFVVEFVSPLEPSPNLALLGQGVRWQDASSGSHDFDIAGSYEAVALASLVSNGFNDDIALMTYDDFYGGQGSAAYESQWGFGNPDLAGNQIDLIRLVVHDITIEPYNPGPPYGEGLQWNGHITWEFWGEPIPEPATLALLALPLLLLRHRRRSNARRRS